MSARNYNLRLKGYVGGNNFEDGYVDYVLSKHKDSPVTVLIDSTGGSLKTALSIAAAFRNHGDVSVHFVGLNASAATIASLGAKHISIDSAAMYLVHKCSSGLFEFGNFNADELSDLLSRIEQTKTDLEKFDANVAEMYARKCKKSPQDLLDLMKVGGWLTAKEALDWGFVDEITDIEEDANAKPKLTGEVAAYFCQDESLKALRLVNLYKGKYKKNPSEVLKKLILENYAKIVSPSDKLVKQLQSLGLIP